MSQPGLGKFEEDDKELTKAKELAKAQILVQSFAVQGLKVDIRDATNSITNFTRIGAISPHHPNAPIPKIKVSSKNEGVEEPEERLSIQTLGNTLDDLVNTGVDVKVASTKGFGWYDVKSKHTNVADVLRISPDGRERLIRVKTVVFMLLHLVKVEEGEEHLRALLSLDPLTNDVGFCSGVRLYHRWWKE